MLNIAKMAGQAEEQYRQLARQLAKDELAGDANVDPDEVQRVCVMSGHSLADLQAHVDRLVQRLRARRQLDEAQSLVDQVDKARAAVNAAEADHAALVAEYQQRIAAAAEAAQRKAAALREVSDRQQRLEREARQVLAQSAARDDDDRRAAINEELQSLQEHLRTYHGRQEGNQRRAEEAEATIKALEGRTEPEAQRTLANVKAIRDQARGDDRQAEHAQRRIPELRAKLEAMEAAKVDPFAMDWA